jgi:uncharacterized membrane protein YphA (DoxX/SURF4 family)
MEWSKISKTLLRIAMSGVFLWFGISQLAQPETFLGWLPAWTDLLPITPERFIVLNGAFEALFGTLLLIGIFTRAVAVLLSLHLVGIALSLGYNDVMVRDVGLALATLSIALAGPDPWCLDARIARRSTTSGWRRLCA